MPERASKREQGVSVVAGRVRPLGEPAAGQPPDGWYELKYVKGFGPYLYFRYWDGPVRRSIYLGKATAKQLGWIRKSKRDRGSRRA